MAGLWETIAGWLTARGLGGAPVGPSPVPPHSSPYAGQERLEIPALTSAELDGLRTGAGLGLARAAELNHYPGPRHVLELAGQLALSAAQRARVEAIHGGMHDEAVRIGREIVEREATLDRRFAHRHIDDASLRELTAEIARLWGELRYTHLAAHLLTRAVLSDEQVAAYDRLRGYGAGGGHEHRAGEH